MPILILFLEWMLLHCFIIMEKSKKIIVSGEKSKGYNEPKAMKNFLIYQGGVAEDIIHRRPKRF